MSQITISAEGISKDYNYNTIFRGISCSFTNPDAVALLGDNGSGKSTLLKILSGMTGPTTGKLQWIRKEKEIPSDHWYEFLSFCSPLFHFDARFTVSETLRMYMEIKPFPAHLSVSDLIDRMNFHAHAHKKMNELSSGMYQRIRLILTICTEAPVLFLDEPCSNLDAAGVQWYNNLIAEFAAQKLIFVASNDPREYNYCTSEIRIMEYK